MLACLGYIVPEFVRFPGRVLKCWQMTSNGDSNDGC